jgi:hypothetical protein
VSLRLEIAPIQTDVKINSLTLLAVHPGVARQVFCFSFLAFGKHSTLSVHKKKWMVLATLQLSPALAPVGQMPVRVKFIFV